MQYLKILIFILFFMSNAIFASKPTDWVETIYPVSEGVLLSEARTVGDNAYNRPSRVLFMKTEMPIQGIPNLLLKSNPHQLAAHVFSSLILVSNIKGSVDELKKVDDPLRGNMMSLILTGGYFHPIPLFDKDIIIPSHLKESEWRSEGSTTTENGQNWYWAIQRDDTIYYISVKICKDEVVGITLDYKASSGYQRLIYGPADVETADDPRQQMTRGGILSILRFSKQDKR